MKYFTPCLLAGFILVSACGPVQVVQTESYDPAPAPAPDVSYQSFYDDLAPYGSWIDYPGYGYVWMPAAGPDFMPYSTNGNWIYTDAGWTWASDYAWGWAPFHYGRWFYDGGYGWMWIPGNEWAPAWVSWRGGNDYYGWAPLGPNVSVDAALGSYNPPMNYWNFVPRRYMGTPGWQNYHVDRSRNVTIINNTSIINNYSGTNRARYAYAPGPDPVEVRRVSGNNFRPVQIREASAPGSRVSGNQFNIYRPRVDAAPANRPDAASRPAPSRVQNLRDVRPLSQNQGNGRPTQPSQNPNTNNRPATQPVVPNPDNNNRPAIAPAPNPNLNNRPATPPAPNPNFNNRQPAVQPAPVITPAPATTGRPTDSRFNRRNANPPAVQQQQQPQQNIPQPSPANRRQMNLRPAAGAQNNQPVRTPPTPVRTAPPAPQPVNQSPKPQDRRNDRPGN